MMGGTDLLERRSSYCRGSSYLWDGESGTLEVTVSTKRSDAYRVVELSVSSGFRGRGFRLEKLAGGTDTDSKGYEVLVAEEGPASDLCDCRAYSRYGYCKHRDSVRSLVGNRWL